MSELYARILSLCNDRGISGYKLCKSTGIQPSVLTDLKMGRQAGLSAKNADKIASFFDVSVGYLLGREEKNDFINETGGWYSPLRFWDKINAERSEFMHSFLQGWSYPVENIEQLWSVSADHPENASNETFKTFLLDAVKAVRHDPESGEWDIVMIPPEKSSNKKLQKAPALTEKDQRDVAREVDRIMDDLAASGDLMFDGVPMSDEARAAMAAAMRIGLEEARRRNKETYTPKKYRKG